MQNKRLISLDLLRGITILTMVLVNNPGDWSNVYPEIGRAHV
jgi:predicted acyltransferase